MARVSMNKLRRRRANGSLSPAAIAVLNSVRPGWHATRDDLWLAVRDEILQWRADHDGDDPRKGSAAAGADEKRLGGWLAHQGGTLTPGSRRFKILEDTLPGWSVTRNDRWNTNHQRALQWREVHGADPRKDGTGIQLDEKRLGQWLAHQRRSLTPTSARYQLLDATLPGWRTTRRGRRSK